MFTLLGPVLDGLNRLGDAVNAALNSPIADAVVGGLWVIATWYSAIATIYGP